MKKLCLSLLILLSLTGCGSANRLWAHVTDYSNICVNGVNYLQFSSGVTVQYDKNGKVVTCN